jgi:hypothetical protein
MTNCQQQQFLQDTPSALLQVVLSIAVILVVISVVVIITDSSLP